MAKGTVEFVVTAKNLVGRSLKRARASFNRLGKAAVGVAKSMATAFIGVAAALAKAAVSANNFRKQVGQIQTISPIKASVIKEEVKQISAEFGVLKENITKGLYDALSAGIPSENIFAFIRVAAKGAIAGAGTVAESVDILTTAINAFKIPAIDAEKVSDALFTTIKLGKTTLSELSASLSVVAPLANASGVSLDQVLGAVTTLTKQGTPTAMAMTQIRQSIVALNENLDDGWSKVMTFQEGVAELAKRAKGSQAELKKMAGRIEAVTGILSLTGSNAAMAATDLLAVSRAAGATGAAFEKMKAVATLDRLLQSFNNILLDIGEETLNNVTGELDRLIEAIDDLRNSDAIPRWADSVRESLITIKPLVEGLVIAFNTMHTGMKFIGGYLGAVIGGAKNDLQAISIAMDVAQGQSGVEIGGGTRRGREGAGRPSSSERRALREKRRALEALQAELEKIGIGGTIASFANQSTSEIMEKASRLANARLEKEREIADAAARKAAHEQEINDLQEKRLEILQKITDENEKSAKLQALDAQIATVRNNIAKIMFRDKVKFDNTEFDQFKKDRDKRREERKKEEEFQQRVKKIRERSDGQGRRPRKRDRKFLEDYEAFEKAKADRKAEEAKIQALIDKRDDIQNQQLTALKSIDEKIKKTLEASP